ncbi:MAG: hypothetical protein RL227_2226 [Pseudomonadota bacterium]|jgi:signal transduction histidine kinase
MHPSTPLPATGTWDLDIVADRVRYAPEFKQRLGLQSPQLYDPTAHWRCRVHPDDLVSMRDALFAHVDGRCSGYQVRFRLRDGHGDYLWVLSCGEAVERDAAGRALRVMGTLTDLTGLHEAALHQAHAELLSRVSHELRTPLNAVLGFSQLMQGQLGTSDLAMQRRQLGHIEQGGLELLDRIEQLLGQASSQPAAQPGGSGSRSSS